MPSLSIDGGTFPLAAFSIETRCKDRLRRLPPRIDYGVREVSGTLTVYFENEDLFRQVSAGGVDRYLTEIVTKPRKALVWPQTRRALWCASLLALTALLRSSGAL